MDFSDQSVLTKLLICSLIVTVSGALTFSFVYFQFQTFSTPDPYDYAQLARALHDGEGFTTRLITPISWFTVPKFPDHPDLWRAPLYPIVVAFGFGLFGVTETVQVGVSAIALIGLGLLLYRITERLYDPLSGLLAGLFVMTVPVIFRAGVSGYAEALYMLIVYSGILVLLRDDDHPYLLGVLSGFAYLTRYNHWFLFVALVIVAIKRCKGNRFLYGVKLVKSYFIVLSPWLIRNLVLTGKPFYHHHMYLIASHNELIQRFDVFYRFNPPDPVLFVLKNPLILLKKWLGNLLKLYQWIPRFVNQIWLLTIFAGYEICVSNGRLDSNKRDLLTVFGLGFLLQGIFLSFIHMKARHYVPLLPVILVFSGAVVARLCRGKFRRYGLLLAGGLVLLNLIFLSGMNPWGNQLTSQDYTDLKQYVPSSEPILTNAPTLTAWYADRISLWVAPFRAVEEKYPSFDYVFFTPEVSRNYSPRINIQQNYLDNREFQELFKEIKRFDKSGGRLYRRRVD